MVEYATVTDKGDKDVNEDALKVFINQPLSTYGFVLADGLGGCGNGDIASNFVVDCVGAAIENTDTFGGTFIDESFETAQNMLMKEKVLKGLPSIKTTLVTLLITDKLAQWGYVGDSRLYHFRNGKIFSRTLDHSVPQMLAVSGQIKEKEIRHHPDRSVLLRALGADCETDFYEIPQRHLLLKKGDAFLLCSDGFWEWIEDKMMLKILKRNLSAFDTLKEMRVEVMKNGMSKNMDNYSAILVKII